MQEYDRTTKMSASPLAFGNGSADMIMTLFDGIEQPKTIRLMDYHKEIITFGRSRSNDIVLTSSYVSREHGRFIWRGGHWVIEDKAAYTDQPSRNGLMFHDTMIVSRVLCEGDLVRIDDLRAERSKEGPEPTFAAGDAAGQGKRLHAVVRSGVSF